MFRKKQKSEMIYFVHIQKTGGTSLKGMVDKYFRPQELYPNKEDMNNPELPDMPNKWLLPYINVECVRGLTPRRKQQIQFLRGHLPFCIGEFFDRPIRYISFFRDPVSRTISHLKHIRFAQKQYSNKNLDELYDDEELIRTQIRDLQTRTFAHHMKDDLRTSFDPLELNPDRLDLAKERIQQLEFFGILEDFDTSVQLFSKQFQLPITKIEKRRVNYDECPVPEGLPERIALDNSYDMQLYEFVKDLYYKRRSQSHRRAG